MAGVVCLPDDRPQTCSTLPTIADYCHCRQLWGKSLSKPSTSPLTLGTFNRHARGVPKTARRAAGNRSLVRSGRPHGRRVSDLVHDFRCGHRFGREATGVGPSS